MHIAHSSKQKRTDTVVEYIDKLAQLTRINIHTAKEIPYEAYRETSEEFWWA